MKAKVFWGTLFLLFISFYTVLAQGNNPCNDQDIDNPCPIDNWVWVLAAFILLAATLHLHRKQKLLLQAK